MLGVRYVRVILEHYPVENYLYSFKRDFVFHGSFFGECTNRKQIIKAFYEDLNPEFVVKNARFELYSSENNLAVKKYIAAFDGEEVE